MMRTFILAFCFLLFHTVLTAGALAWTPGPQPSRQAVKVAAAVARLGSGENALVALRLQDKTLVKGRIAAIARDSFVVTDNESGIGQRVAYAQVARLEGINLASGRRVGVNVGFKAKLARVAGFLLPGHRVQANSMTNGEKTLLIGIAVGILIAIVLAKAL